MEIGSKECIRIFKANFDWEIIDTKIGQGVVMPPKEAFIFSIVTGAGYLDNPLYQFTPKGLMKLFYNAFDYKFVSGIFENATLKHTPYILSKVKPFLFNGSKIIVPVEIETELKLQATLKEFYSCTKNPTDYLILRIEKSKKGNGMEGFMEYLVSEFFKTKGFIVENQIPLAHAIGSPDFGGYHLTQVFDSLKKHGILSNKGFHIIELSLLRLFDSSSDVLQKEMPNATIVGEAKTSTTIMQKQLNKYLETGLFEFGIEIHPSKSKPSSDEFATFSIDPTTFKIIYNPSKVKSVYTGKYSKSDYYCWLEDYMKFYLLANLDNDELSNFYFEVTSNRRFSQIDLVNFIKSVSIDKLVNFISKKK